MKKSLATFFLFVLILPIAAGDIRTSNTYHTRGGSVSEEVNLHNADYFNMVVIGTDSMFSRGSAWPSDEDVVGTVSSSLNMDSKDGDFGSHVSVKAEEFACDKSFVAGSVNSVGHSYTLGTGEVQSGSHDSSIRAEEKVLLEGLYYSGVAQANGQGIGLSGRGTRISTEDSDSKFEHNLMLSQNDKWGNAELNLECNKGDDCEEDSTPAVYVWDSSVQSSRRGRWAQSSIDARVVAGDRHVDMSMTGTSSVPLFGDGSNQVKKEKHVKALVFEDDMDLEDLIKMTITEELYMSFVIDYR